MTKTSRQDPRANQKARTRAAIVEAAARLLARSGPPTVAEAADEAKVSKATAYRYFPTSEALLLEVSELTPAVAPVEAMLDALPDELPAEDRLLRLVDSMAPIVQAEEVPMRAALRVYLETWLRDRGSERASSIPVREGRRIRWLDAVLAPVRRELGDARAKKLRSALAFTLGIEALVVLKDVCRIDDEGEALSVQRWAAAALLRAALDEARGARKKRG
ncbi:MAG: TetR/AcrR family transcriptional regulator [Planctomycetota bacterium]